MFGMTESEKIAGLERLRQRTKNREDLRQPYIDAVEELAFGIEMLDLEVIYKSSVKRTAIEAYATVKSDWNKPMVITEREERYLMDLSSLVYAVDEGNMLMVDEIVDEMRPLLGSVADIQGIPCDPEVAAISGIVMGIVKDLRGRGVLEKADVMGRTMISRSVTKILEAATSGSRDRAEIAKAIFDLNLSVSFRQRGVGVIDGVMRKIVPVGN